MESIQVVLNYWEYSTTQTKSALDSLVCDGVTAVSAFVPWQHFETDIQHKLLRFLQIATDRKIKVQLIVTPEAGVHYPACGIPKDVLSKPEYLARDGFGKSIPIALPPVAFDLPSLSHPEVSKRYFSFLSRLQLFLQDLEKHHPYAFERITVAIGGSFWKLLQSGDHSKGAQLQKNQALEDFFSLPEFEGQSLSKWRTKDFEATNERWFHAHAEQVFRHRCYAILSRTLRSKKLRQTDFSVPEADVNAQRFFWVASLAGLKPDFRHFLNQLEDTPRTIACFGGLFGLPLTYWSSMGRFSALPKTEKQFLVYASMLIQGGRSGGTLVDWDQWREFSKNFKTRALGLSQMLESAHVKSRQEIGIVSFPMSSGRETGFASDSMIAQSLHRRFPLRVSSFTDSFALVSETQETAAGKKIVWLDEQLLVTKSQLGAAMDWVSARDAVLVIPSFVKMTPTATAKFQSKIKEAGKPIECTRGYRFEVYLVGEGKLVVYHAPKTQVQQEFQIRELEFIDAMAALAEMNALPAATSPEVITVPFFLKLREELLNGVFCLNGGEAAVEFDLLFGEGVQVQDFVGAVKGATQDSGGEVLETSTKASLTLSPKGIVSLVTRAELTTEKKVFDGDSLPLESV